MHKRIISCLLAAVILLGAVAFTACNKKDDGIPEGMKSVTIGGEPFILYVPEGWTDNRDSGISSAYYSMLDAVTVSARYYQKDNADITLDGYIDNAVASYANSYPSYDTVGRTTTKLGSSIDARRLEFTFDRTGDDGSTAKMTVIQYYTESGDSFILLSFYCLTSAISEEYSKMFEQIRANFVVKEPDSEDETPVTDKYTPEGMKIASHEHNLFVFYVPLSWKCNMSDKMSEAYYPESGKPNVTVTSYVPYGENNTVEDYFLQCEEIYKKEINGYELISKAERKVAERKGYSYTYKAVYGEVEFRIMQTIVMYDEIAYSITYTARVDAFDSHLDDVNKMLDGFRFKKLG